MQSDSYPIGDVFLGSGYRRLRQIRLLSGVPLLIRVGAAAGDIVLTTVTSQMSIRPGQGTLHRWDRGT